MGGNTSTEYSPTDSQPSEEAVAADMAEYVEAVVGKVSDFRDNE